MAIQVDRGSIAHRVRCATIRLGRVIRCPDCGYTYFDGWSFDSRRDPGVGPLMNSADEGHMGEVIRALLDMTALIYRHCERCSQQPYDQEDTDGSTTGD